MNSMNQKESLGHILALLPKSPGVYQMKEKDGKVIYVGKAKNLFSRVNSYFREWAELTVAKKQMVTRVADIEIILCKNEVEALVLETNLIKHLSPKYNILMKDDKNLSYIKITKEDIPEVYRTREKKNDGALYFWPYTSGANINASLGLLRRIFMIRACRMKFQKKDNMLFIADKAGRTPPCMDYYIGICPAPCLLEEEKIRKHHDNIEELEDFLAGKSHTVIEGLRHRMLEHAKKQEFEEAQKLKENIGALETIGMKQIARDGVEGDLDIFILMEKYESYFIGLMHIRSSEIIGVFRYRVYDVWEDKEVIATQFLARHYAENDHLPRMLFLAEEIPDESLHALLREKGIAVHVPQIGPKKEMVDFAKNQTREYAYKDEMEKLQNQTLTRLHMENVLVRLGYPVPKKWPIIFECYDISHTHWRFTYASRVVIKNGKPDPQSYKKYKIHTLQSGDIDDFASHKEVMIRRTIEWVAEENFPDLIIIDGGKWQLSSAISGIKEGIYEYWVRNPGSIPLLPLGKSFDTPIPICSIAKREEEIFLPEKKEAVMFEKGTPELMVLQKARDESHRFSITANRQARTKAMKKNVLEELPWFGPITRKKLLKLAGSLDGVKNLSEEEILQVANRAQLETLRDHGICGGEIFPLTFPWSWLE